MNTMPDDQLPSELLPFKENIAATVEPYIEIKAKKDKDLRLWQSKFGGLPYLPKGSEYPRDSAGQHMFLLAQLNFAEIPGLAPFPEKGILQFYISGQGDLYGADFDDLERQAGFRVLSFADVVEDLARLTTDFSFLPVSDMLPLQASCSLTFSRKQAPISAVDYQFESRVLGQSRPGSEEELYKVYEAYEKLYPSTGHKIGGYPYFTQNDPRHDHKYRDGSYRLLFQMDTDWQVDILWGDCGVGNFFIRDEDLRNRHFSRVLYNWDCS